MKSDDYLLREYPSGWNCWDFVRHVVLKESGRNLLYSSPDAVSRYGSAVSDALPDFVRLPAPQDGCLVLFLHKRRVPHIGVYFDGRALHYRKDGPRYEPIDVAADGAEEVRYYSHGGSPSL